MSLLKGEGPWLLANLLIYKERRVYRGKLYWGSFIPFIWRQTRKSPRRAILLPFRTETIFLLQTKISWYQFDPYRQKQWFDVRLFPFQNSSYGKNNSTKWISLCRNFLMSWFDDCPDLTWFVEWDRTLLVLFTFPSVWLTCHADHS